MRHHFMAIALFVVPVSVAAQTTSPLPQLEADARIRVWSDSTAGALKARVRTATHETLEVAGDAATARVFHVSDIQRVDVSRGRNRLGWTLGGMLVGATAGIVISRADNDEGNVVGGLDETAEGMANTLSGALIGGVVGFFVAPERWRTVWRK